MKQIPKFSDHIASGKVNEAKALTKKKTIEKFNLIENADGTYDAPSDVDLSNMGLTKLPLKFGKVKGYFYCAKNYLTSLEGCPSEVGNWFDCSKSRLNSLIGGPKKVGGNFYCNNNLLTSLDGCPSEVGGDFYCGYNHLTSLESCITKIVGDFNCTNNLLTELPKELNCKNLSIYRGNDIKTSPIKGVTGNID